VGDRRAGGSLLPSFLLLAEDANIYSCAWTRR
jgi:hypothetical protein